MDYFWLRCGTAVCRGEAENRRGNGLIGLFSTYFAFKSSKVLGLEWGKAAWGSVDPALVKLLDIMPPKVLTWRAWHHPLVENWGLPEKNHPKIFGVRCFGGCFQPRVDGERGLGESVGFGEI